MIAVSIAVVVAVQTPMIAYQKFANVDEAYAAALASRLLDGYKLYDGAVSQRGPMMYYLFAGIAKLHGWDNILALRLWALAISLLNLGCCYWLGRVMFGRQAAALAMLIASYALGFGFPATDGIALHGEALQFSALVAACVWGIKAVAQPPASSSRVRWLVLCGLAFGVVISIKQSAALHPVPLIVWLIADAKRRQTGWRSLCRDLAILAGTSALLPLVFVLNSLREGTLERLYYYCVVYNRDVHLRPTTKYLKMLPSLFFRYTDQTAFVLVSFVSVFVAAFALWGRIARWRATGDAWVVLRGFGAKSFLLLQILIAVGSASMMWRFFPHYYLPALPFMAALGAYALCQLRPSRPLRGLVLGGMTFLLTAAGFATYFGEFIDGEVTHERSPVLVGKYIEASTKPTDRIFVWGFSPWLYQYSHRKPAGRFVFETYVTGFVPWYWEKLEIEKARIVPGSVEALLDDLEREKPEIIVDAGSIMMARSMRLYEKPAAFLHKGYCFESRFGAFDIYRRKITPTCSHPWLPRPHEPLDWNGRQLGVPLPLLPDQDRSRRLPRGNFTEPIWFAEGAPPPAAALEASRDRRRLKDEAQAEGFVIERFDPLSPEP